MVPLVDVHCHLLAGLDDGPRDWEQVVAMCRMAWEDGTRAVAATAHQGPQWQEVTPARITSAAAELGRRLAAANIPLAVYPTGEVMVCEETEALWQSGALQSMGGHGSYLLIELPMRADGYISELVRRFVRLGIRPILAHAERYPELFWTRGLIEQLVLSGCLIQVNAGSITQDQNLDLKEQVRDWVCRGVVHLVGSDAHSVHRRPPGLAAAYDRLAGWVGFAAADRICSLNGMAVLEGFPIDVPRPAKSGWFARRRR